ncbi:cytidylyltransferase, partial [Xanthomonas citri pv. citri]|nr:cytidylyltransferase [Xanthomonas citri pv. citri]
AFTAGPSVPRRDDSELDQSVMILGGQAFAGPNAPSAAEIRAMLATAVNRGVNHVEVGRGDHNAEEILHKCGEPQLTQRLHFISRLREMRT